jgi:hypothetical protein
MPREFHLDKTHFFSLFLNTLSCHQKYLCDNLFNANKVHMKLPQRLNGECGLMVIWMSYWSHRMNAKASLNGEIHFTVSKIATSAWTEKWNWLSVKGFISLFQRKPVAFNVRVPGCAGGAAGISRCMLRRRRKWLRSKPARLFITAEEVAARRPQGFRRWSLFFPFSYGVEIWSLAVVGAAKRGALKCEEGVGWEDRVRSLASHIRSWPSILV